MAKRWQTAWQTVSVSVIHENKDRNRGPALQKALDALVGERDPREQGSKHCSATCDRADGSRLSVSVIHENKDRNPPTRRDLQCGHRSVSVIHENKDRNLGPDDESTGTGPVGERDPREQGSKQRFQHLRRHPRRRR